MAPTPIEEVTTTLRFLVADLSGTPPDTVQPDSRFVEDLGCDSLDSIEIVMAVEDVFDFSIPDDDMKQILTTVGALATYIVEHR